MDTNPQTDINDFCVAGVNYKKTDATTRGLFAINNDLYEQAVARASDYGISSFFILSTCNRTEIYGFASHVHQLAGLLCSQTGGGVNTFLQLAYLKKGKAAIEHLFSVGAGLDSQILGDYEIVGQLKQAAGFAKERGCINAFTDRLVNSVFRASKEVKTNTALSSGTVSASFAAVQYIKKNVIGYADCKMALLGMGKIGSTTCRNLVDYLGAKDITLINRTDEKAADLAEELGLNHAPYTEIDKTIAAADIVLVATGAGEPLVLKRQLENAGDKLIIDLSVPAGVAKEAAELPNVTVINVDDLSKLKDETLKMREAEVPAARAIIADHIAEFENWCGARKNVSLLHTIKAHLNEIAAIRQRELNNPATRCPYIAAEQKIQQVVNRVAGKMRNQNQSGCYYLQAIVEFTRDL